MGIRKIGTSSVPPSTGGGLPAGGSTGQIAAKTSGVDYAVGWIDKTNLVPPSNQTIFRGSANLSQATATYADISATSLPALSLTLAVGDVADLELIAGFKLSSAGIVAGFDWLVDQPVSADTNLRGSFYAAWIWEGGTNGNDIETLTIKGKFVATEAGVHTFKPQWKCTGGTVYLVQDAASTYTSPAVHTVTNRGPLTSAVSYAPLVNTVIQRSNLNTNTSDTVTNSTTFAIVPGQAALSVPAVAGDVLEIEFVGTWFGNGGSATIRVVPGINGVAQAQTTGTGTIFVASFVETSSYPTSHTYTVQAGDITAGVVSVSAMYKTTANADLRTDASSRPMFKVTNWRQ